MLLQERLNVNWAVHPETLDAFVPNMLLQPLIENSVKHGISEKENGGTINIAVNRVDHNLSIDVIDDGVANKAVKSPTEGIGIINTKERLRYLYGDDQTFESGPQKAGGWKVAVTLPFRT